jgi:hypothetical protein
MIRFALVALSGLLLLSVNAQATDDNLPADIKAFIGKTVPRLGIRNQSEIPGWREIEGGWIVRSGWKGPEGILLFSELQKGDITVLAIESVIGTTKQTMTILDAIVIPKNLLNVYKDKGKIKEFITLRDQIDHSYQQLYRVSASCWGTHPDAVIGKEILIGLWQRANGNDCGGNSTSVKKAWILNLESGKLSDIKSSDDMYCKDPDEMCGQD